MRACGRQLLVLWGVLAIATAACGGSAGSRQVKPSPTASSVAVSGEALAGYPGNDAEDPEVDGGFAPVLKGKDFAGRVVRIGFEMGANGKKKAVLFVAHWCHDCSSQVRSLAAWLEAHSLPANAAVYIVATGNDPKKVNYPAVGVAVGRRGGEGTGARRQRGGATRPARSGTRSRRARRTGCSSTRPATSWAATRACSPRRSSTPRSQRWRLVTRCSSVVAQTTAERRPPPRRRGRRPPRPPRHPKRARGRPPPSRRPHRHRPGPRPRDSTQRAARTARRGLGGQQLRAPGRVRHERRRRPHIKCLNAGSARGRTAG